jgi:hypothetical protein
MTKPNITTLRKMELGDVYREYTSNSELVRVPGGWILNQWWSTIGAEPTYTSVFISDVWTAQIKT